MFDNSDNSLPYSAIRALFAVIRLFLLLKALKHTSLAIPVDPPISSITRSTFLDLARLMAFGKNLIFLNKSLLFFLLFLYEIPVIRKDLP